MNIKIFLLAATMTVLILPVVVFSQDLGSSTEVLKTTKKTKATPRTRTSPTKRRSTTRRTSTSSKKKNNTRPAATPDVAEKITPVAEIKPEKKVEIKPANEIVIKVGEKVTGNFDELYEKAIEEGNAARNERNYDAAETAYLRGKSLRTDDYRAAYGLGNLYSDQARWEESETAYREAIKIEPGVPEPYIALSFVLTQPIAGTNLIERYSEAEKLARKALELDPQNSVANDQLGVALELQGDISEATQSYYEKAVRTDPTFALAYAHLGRLLRKRGSIAESSQAYVNAIQFSVDVPTMIQVADVMQSQQKYLDSEQLLRRALKEDPKNPTALYLLGKALTTRGTYDEAESVLKKSAQVSPRSFVSYTLLGSLFLRQKKLESAEKYLEEAVKVVSQNEKRRLALDFEAVGDAYLQNGRNADAGRMYRKAFALDEARSDIAKKLKSLELN
ncbi:MAG: tetratricopeptide repeat protein [Pyrinomonadaceae bacterium]|nr:tetratricopeptide repeat protein [Pyrinomonadaceae bacterium]